MNTIKIAVALTMIVGSSPGMYGVQAAGFGLPGLGSSSSKGSGNLDEDIGKFNVKSASANDLVTKGAINIIAAIKSKEDGAELTKKLEATNTISDPKERDAQRRVVTDEAMKIANTAAQNPDMDKIKTLSDDQKKSLVKSFFNFSLGVFVFKDLIPVGQSIISSVSSNPMAATKIVDLKGSLSSIKGVIDNSAAIAVQMPKLFTAAGITPMMPSSSTDAPQAETI